MKMKIQKLNTVLLLSIMAATTMTSFSINAAELRDQSQDYQVIEENVIDTDDVGMESYITGLTMLTEQEKAQLLETEQKLKEDFKTLDRIYQTLDDRLDQALQGLDLEKMYDDVMSKNESLWKKLEDNLTSEQEEVADERAFIKASKALTEAEKDTLLKEVEEREKLDKIFEEKEAEVLRENSVLVEQAEKIEEKIQAEDAKNQSIWDKVAQYEVIDEDELYWPIILKSFSPTIQLLKKTRYTKTN